ncbi:HAMP domain-containing sensor histidine kinase [Vibrio sp. PP-XX7]
MQQEFLATAAHELKTPLALIRGQIEMEDNLSPSSHATLLGDVDYMARQVYQLLHLTEVSEEQNYQFKIVDVNQVIEDVTRYLQRYAAHRNIVLHTHLPSFSIPVNADESALFILLKNLVENAILHTRTGKV